MPDAYERWLVPAVFHPFAVDLARRAEAHAPKRVLELAAGTGVLTRELLAVCPDAEVTATDLNDAMVDLGREHAPAAVWRQADAMHLPFDGNEFDLIVSQFGVMFFPGKPAAFAEARRVLTRDGSLLFSTWAALDDHDFQAALVAGLESAFPEDPPTFMVALPHGYADVDAVLADLATGYCTGTPLRAEIESRGDLDATTSVVARAMQARLGTDPVVGRMTAYVFDATPLS